ncbi:homoserine dehydrogenase [Alicyclobacillus fastidiosus]|uniref:Homoserine dehydrogenase n=1 Tax=Alicyclobacillus fastidiosus TaxID=392011 RepID=A0ABV5AIQ3_9BACL|nr:homoserine dehydrogenase [Alicyclobacillus fastidiosus]WEH07807.1 homoserine dehydrogenase [Alicyclobacillus fastidiosus]
MAKLGIGLLGCGVVGTGILRVIDEKRALLANEHGLALDVRGIVVRDVHRTRDAVVDLDKLRTDWLSVCTDDEIDVVIEVMGGIDTARDAVLTALRNGKSVVTANKEMMAKHGQEIRQVARDHGAYIRFEASVLAGIPVVHTLETYFQLSEILRLRGIMNGTSNYILTRMHNEDLAFADALAFAQALGYAEADPAMDVDGVDAWCKLQILLDCIGVPQGARVGTDIEGIRGVSKASIAAAKRQHQKVKHVVCAEWDPQSGFVTWNVGPQVVSPEDPLYAIDDVQNAICIDGDVSGTITLSGPGAGALPTASGILEDVLKIARKLQVSVPV